MTIDSNYQDYPPGKQLELAELEESASAIIGRPIRMKDPKWLSAWGSDLKIARTYRLGCVFIAGDAAHTHSPAGGQGLNTGVQDAFNLAWKLAAVIKGWAPAYLLDSYEAERHAIGKRVLKASDVLLRTLLIRRPLGRWLRDRIVRALVKTGSINRFLVLNLSAIGFRYRTGTGKRAGQRLPDMTFRGPARAPERTYELLRDSLGYTLFLFVSPKQARQLARNIQAIIALGSPLLRVHVVLSSGLPESYDFGVPCSCRLSRRLAHADRQRRAARHPGAAGCLYRVRPRGTRRCPDPRGLGVMDGGRASQGRRRCSGSACGRLK